MSKETRLMEVPPPRPQIDGWKAIAFAADRNAIDDHYDRLQFLEDVLENDFISIAELWPSFVHYCNTGEIKTDEELEDMNG